MPEEAPVTTVRPPGSEGVMEIGPGKRELRASGVGARRGAVLLHPAPFVFGPLPGRGVALDGPGCEGRVVDVEVPIQAAVLPHGGDHLARLVAPADRRLGRRRALDQSRGWVQK